MQTAKSLIVDTLKLGTHDDIAFDTTLANLGIKRTARRHADRLDRRSSQTLGQADFLKLMTAQLKNQDPFEPVDNTQMVAQMAQFSSLSGITEMNTTLKAIAAKLAGTSTSDALAYVGKTVLTEGDDRVSRAPPAASPARSSSTATRPTSTSRSRTPNGADAQDHRASAQQAKGTVAFDWDGITDSGDRRRRGPVQGHRRPRATPAARSSAAPLVWAPVTSVSMAADGQPILNASRPRRRSPFPPSARSADPAIPQGVTPMSFYTSLSAASRPPRPR